MAEAQQAALSPRMKKHYEDVVRPAMIAEFGYKNVMEVPTIEKIAVAASQRRRESRGPTRATAANKSGISYTVKAGESLIGIANQMGISAAELAALNDLNSRAGLRIGQQIMVPQTMVDYKVKRGDTLIGLATRYGVETGKLAEMNDLQPNTQLRMGEVIKVPNL